MPTSQFEAFKRAQERMWVEFYLVVVFLCLIYLLWKVSLGRKKETSYSKYARDVFLGIAFVLVMAFCGPLIALAWHPNWEWGFGFLFSGFLQWVYVLPTLAYARRAGKLGFRQGVLGAAVIFLILDSIAILVLMVLGKALGGLR